MTDANFAGAPSAGWRGDCWLTNRGPGSSLHGGGHRCEVGPNGAGSTT